MDVSRGQFNNIYTKKYPKKYTKKLYTKIQKYTKKLSLLDLNAIETFLEYCNKKKEKQNIDILQDLKI